MACGQPVVAAVVVTVAAVLAAGVAGRVTEGEEDDRTHHNYATTSRGSGSGWVFPLPRGEVDVDEDNDNDIGEGRQSTRLQRLWGPEGDVARAMPRHDPFLPRLQENDFGLEEEDYDQGITNNLMWLPQVRRFHQPPASLQNLEHLLEEGEVVEANPPPSVEEEDENDMLGVLGDGEGLVGGRREGGKGGREEGDLLPLSSSLTSSSSDSPITTPLKHHHTTTVQEALHDLFPGYYDTNNIHYYHHQQADTEAPRMMVPSVGDLRGLLRQSDEVFGGGEGATKGNSEGTEISNPLLLSGDGNLFDTKQGGRMVMSRGASELSRPLTLSGDDSGDVGIGGGEVSSPSVLRYDSVGGQGLLDTKEIQTAGERERGPLVLNDATDDGDVNSSPLILSNSDGGLKDVEKVNRLNNHSLYHPNTLNNDNFINYQYHHPLHHRHHQPAGGVVLGGDGNIPKESFKSSLSSPSSSLLDRATSFLAPSAGRHYSSPLSSLPHQEPFLENLASDHHFVSLSSSSSSPSSSSLSQQQEPFLENLLAQDGHLVVPAGSLGRGEVFGDINTNHMKQYHPHHDHHHDHHYDDYSSPSFVVPEIFNDQQGVFPGFGSRPHPPGTTIYVGHDQEDDQQHQHHEQQHQQEVHQQEQQQQEGAGGVDEVVGRDFNVNHRLWLSSNFTDPPVSNEQHHHRHHRPPLHHHTTTFMGPLQQQQQQQQQSKGVVEEEEQVERMDDNEGEGEAPHSWLPFHLPSSKDLIAAFTHPGLTQEGQREVCHARNLHTCGGRVIAEFSRPPSTLVDPCRIREEFLDCMEEERGRGCEVQGQSRGQSFTREDTRRIKDQVKKLLWSARGCILGHSA